MQKLKVPLFNLVEDLGNDDLILDSISEKQLILVVVVPEELVVVSAMCGAVLGFMAKWPDMHWC
ncbi:hypothetical protein C5167_035376 [Papaver somniferum]|uniref:Uncharacterized protein n=1 Tax=Papaver somniferum TaxID=3469 RepID=A0A4Y7KK00_PAPSO|nr:hypothetical protein C5167_035376 [Papaver somniferum]